MPTSSPVAEEEYQTFQTHLATIDLELYLAITTIDVGIEGVFYVISQVNFIIPNEGGDHSINESVNLELSLCTEEPTIPHYCNREKSTKIRLEVASELGITTPKTPLFHFFQICQVRVTKVIVRCASLSIQNLSQSIFHQESKFENPSDQIYNHTDLETK